MSSESFHPPVFLQLLYPEELMSAIREASLEPRKLSSLHESSEVARLLCPHVCLDFAALGPAMWFTGAMASSCYTLIFVMECPEPGRSFNFGIEHQGGFMGFFAPGAALDGMTPRGYKNATLTVPCAEFLSAASIHCPELPQSVLKQGSAIRVSAADQRILRSLLDDVLDTIRFHPESFASAEALRELEEDLLAAFLGALRGDDRKPVGPNSNRFNARHSRFRKVRDYVSGNPDRPFQLRDLCTESGLSARGLENLFQDFTGTNPLTFVRHQKLHVARRRLLTSAPRPGLIKNIALDLGFWHLGRFSSYYREFFGEGPRETCGASAFKGTFPGDQIRE